MRPEHMGTSAYICKPATRYPRWYCYLFTWFCFRYLWNGYAVRTLYTRQNLLGVTNIQMLALYKVSVWSHYAMQRVRRCSLYQYRLVFFVIWEMLLMYKANVLFSDTSTSILRCLVGATLIRKFTLFNFADWKPIQQKNIHGVMVGGLLVAKIIVRTIQLNFFKCHLVVDIV